MNLIKHKAAISVIAFATLSVAGLAVAKPGEQQLLTDQLLAELLERHTPAQMYQQANNDWPGGKYSLTVFKGGEPRITSASTSIDLQMPLKIVIKGNASNDLLRVKLACSASFTTLGNVRFRPKTPGDVSVLESEITLPIPPTNADCDGVKVPVDPYLKAMIAEKKREWELQVDEKVNAWLAK